MYPTTVQGNFLDNKYTQWYFKIIESAKNNHDGYFEKHHIVPKSLGGSNSKTNIVKLTARQHFICHLLLVKMTSGNDKRKMIFAAHHMSICHRRDKYKISSITYERLKLQMSNLMKGNQLGKNVVWNKKLREKLSHSLQNSEALKNRGDSWKLNISKAQSRTVVLINAETCQIVGEWQNCSKLAKHLKCNRAGIKAAIRNGTYIGLKIKTLNKTRHWVRWKDDLDAKPIKTLEQLKDEHRNRVLESWKLRKS